MSQLHIVFFSQTEEYRQIIEYFYANVSFLLEKNINFCHQGLFARWFSHQHFLGLFWNACTKNESVFTEDESDLLEKYFDDLEQIANCKEDLMLIYSSNRFCALHEFIKKIEDTQKYPFLAQRQVHVVWMICRQDLEAERAIHSFYHAERVDLVRSVWRSEKFRGVPGEILLTAEQAVSMRNLNILIRDGKRCFTPVEILRAIGVEENEIDIPPLKIFSLQSRDASVFLSLLSPYCSNGYPSCSSVKLMESLAAVEADALDSLDCLTFLEPEEHRLIRERAEDMNRECARHFFQREILFPPFCFPEKNCQWHPYPGFDSDACQRLADALLRTEDASLRDLLWRRFDIDAPLIPANLIQFAQTLYRTFGRVWPPPPATVAVLTLTCNQKNMIDRAIESVMAQKTNFSIEHIIVDDGSTDGAQDIIAAYADNYSHIKPVFLSQKSYGGANVAALFSRCRSPYVALCDGDDYFTDPNKLQTQVDFMEAHPECGLCFHPVKVVYEDGSGRERIYPPLGEMPRGVREFYYLADLMRVNFIQTNSVMYRWRFTEGLPDWFVPDLVPGDWYWHLLHAEMGKIGFINKIMSVYRRHRASLFYASEISPKANRLRHGLSELRSYDVINKHFKGRYAKVLQPLANNVFANFLEHYMETDDNALLTTASERFPELAKDFFAEVKVVRVPGGRS